MKKKFILGNVLAHLTSMTLTFDTNINRVRLLSRMNVWTNYEEGRSKRSRVIDRKRNGYRGTDLQTDRQHTDRHVQSNMPSQTDRLVQSNMPSLLRSGA